MPTLRQIKAVKNMSENVGNKSLGKILKEAGYSDSVSKTPNRVLKTKGWLQLMEEYFPDEKLLKLHKELLEKKEIIAYQGEYIKTDQPHSDVKYALDLLYKLKGKYIPDPSLTDPRNVYDRMSMDELEEAKKQAIAENKLLAERYEKYMKNATPKLNVP